MTSLIILSILGFISIIFLVVIKIKGKKLEILSFLSTLIATLIGVLLAVTLSNMEVDKKEKADTVKLLKSANNIVNGTYNYNAALEIQINEMEQDSINISDSTLTIIKENNPIPYPDLMETIITNELVSKNLSEFSHNKIFSGLINLRKVAKYSSLPLYKRLLKELSLVLELEIEYQNGNLTLEELSTKLEKSNKDLIKNYPIPDGIEVRTNSN